VRFNVAAALLVMVGILFATFFLNVLFGAIGLPLFLTNLAELLLLFASCATFVAATLQLEKNNRA